MVAMPGMGRESAFRGTERFEIRRRIGSGAMGVVYEAYDRESETLVALKTLREIEPHALLRFKAEFRALQDIQHPNLVRLGELIEEDGKWFFTMELIRGVSFRSHVFGGEPAVGDSDDSRSVDTVPEHAATAPARQSVACDETRLRAALGQLALGLSAIHDGGKIHRDIKPSNILVTSAGRVALLDFGVVTGATVDEQSCQQHAVGTPEYMAPEQAAGVPLSAAADWYSVGVILYEALTGKLPFSGKPVDVMIEKQQRSPPPPRALLPDVPPDLDALCEDLLRTDPRARPEGREIRKRLAVESSEASPSMAKSRATVDLPFVGRTVELGSLDVALRSARKGQAMAVFVHGTSGVGKSELVNRFTRSVVARKPDAVVLAGRCYERESVPYKALDGIADALSNHMRRLPKLRAAELLPVRARLLPQLFPTLQRVECIAEAPRSKIPLLDPQERRARMFAAFRDLLGRLAMRSPVLLLIDDFQWADTDSLTLLRELLAPPDEPALLVVATVRLGAKQGIEEVIAEAGLTCEVRGLPVDPLSLRESRKLIQLAAPAIAEDEARRDAIARDGAGHPMFIHELLRHVASTSLTGGQQLTLDEVLRDRVARLDREPQQLLHLLAVAATPITRETASAASRLSAQDFDKASSTLRVECLARSSGIHRGDLIETYHDRVGQAVAAELGTEHKAELHLRLAIALEVEGAANSDPQVLVRHFEAAGQPLRAAEHAESAARRAAGALVFDQATEFWREALRLGDYTDDRARELRVELATALANAGRCAQAAEAFLVAAQGADPVTRMDCQRRAAEQLLISGHIEPGLEAIRGVLREIGVTLPTTSRRALASLVWHRIKLRLRGLRWTEKHENQLSDEVLNRIDVHKAVGHGLAMVDNIRGADFQARTLLLSLQAGEVRRVAVALGTEAVFVGSQGGRGLRRARRLVDEARKIGEGSSDPYMAAWAQLADGAVCYWEGRFRAAADLLGDGEVRMRNETTGSTWEVSNARQFRLFSLRHLGALGEMRRYNREYVRDAVRRGDRYVETSVRRYCSFLGLADGDPDASRRRLDQVTWVAPSGSFHLQHWYELEARCELAIYEGGARAAFDDLQNGFRGLGRSLLLRVQILRCIASWVQARLLLAAAEPGASAPELSAAHKVARSLAGEGIGFATVFSLLVEAGIAQRQGRTEMAAERLQAAAQSADQQDMALCAAAARSQHGKLIGGSEGANLIATADQWMKSAGIADPERMGELIVTGTSDQRQRTSRAKP